MLDVGAAFAGGLLIRQTLEEIQLPKIHQNQGSETSFKLSVRCVAASVPVLGQPGVFSRQRPLLEVSLGEVHKETELADYVEGGSSGSRQSGYSSKDCPWVFGESITFKVGLKDLMGPGLRLKLKASSDYSLGPVSLQMSHFDDVGEACVDLRQKALPGCIPKGQVWESPVLLIPLNHVRGGVIKDGQGLGQAVGHVAMSFITDVDPEMLLEAAEAESRSVSDILMDKADGVMRWFNPDVGTVGQSSRVQPDIAASGSGHRQAEVIGSTPKPQEKAVQFMSEEDFAAVAIKKKAMGTRSALRTLKPGEVEATKERANSRKSEVPLADQSLAAPDLDPDGWISRKGPNGRYHWHHKSLGLAPWEDGSYVPGRAGG